MIFRVWVSSTLNYLMKNSIISIKNLYNFAVKLDLHLIIQLSGSQP